MTKYFKNFSNKKVKPVPPRAADEIQKDYGKTVSDAGQAQYQAYIYAQQVEQLNAKLRDLNQEFTARQALDAKEAELTKEETVEVKNA